VLGDSVKRRQPPAKRPALKKASKPAAPGGRRKFWIAVLVALAVPFAVGYGIAVRVLFPPPAVVAEGIAVPRLVGQTLEAAQRSLTEAGLGGIQPSELPSLTVPGGTVIAQSPLAGQQLRASAPVRVAVSSGPPRVFVPDVVGFPVERAASLLIRLGFQVQRTDTVSAADAGRVIGINPGPGSRIVLPARVAITVSLGPPPDTTAVDTLGVPIDTVSAGVRVGWSGRSRRPIFSKLQRVAPHDDTQVNGRN
jgi:serine/threonine-protein kinase